MICFNFNNDDIDSVGQLWAQSNPLISVFLSNLSAVYAVQAEDSPYPSRRGRKASLPVYKSLTSCLRFFSFSAKAAQTRALATGSTRSSHPDSGEPWHRAIAEGPRVWPREALIGCWLAVSFFSSVVLIALYTWWNGEHATVHIFLFSLSYLQVQPPSVLRCAFRSSPAMHSVQPSVPICGQSLHCSRCSCAVSHTTSCPLILSMPCRGACMPPLTASLCRGQASCQASPASIYLLPASMHEANHGWHSNLVQFLIPPPFVYFIN
jgi:hypothetical protein